MHEQRRGGENFLVNIMLRTVIHILAGHASHLTVESLANFYSVWSTPYVDLSFG